MSTISICDSYNIYCNDYSMAATCESKYMHSEHLIFTSSSHLGHTDCLLFHCFMDTGLVVFSDTAEFINTTQPSIRQHKSSSLQLPLATVLMKGINGKTQVKISAITSCHKITLPSNTYNFIHFFLLFHRFYQQDQRQALKTYEFFS